MSAIKPGDLVYIDKPYQCCGQLSGHAYMPFVLGEHSDKCFMDCSICGALSLADLYSSEGLVKNTAVPLGVLKKVNPPAKQESLPTRADLDIPEPACP